MPRAMKRARRMFRCRTRLRGAGRSRQGSRRHRKIVEAGIAATAAETVGAMEAMNEMTLEYSKTGYNSVSRSGRIRSYSTGCRICSWHRNRAQHGVLGDDVDGQRRPVERRHDFALAKVGVGQAGRLRVAKRRADAWRDGMTRNNAVGITSAAAWSSSGCSATRRIICNDWRTRSP